VADGLSRRGFVGATAGSLAAVAIGSPHPASASVASERRARHWRVALNSIQWIATPDGWINPALLPPLSELLPLIKSAGFDAMHPDIPAGMSTQEFLSWLRRTA
jgi:hypothetical protein